MPSISKLFLSLVFIAFISPVVRAQEAEGRIVVSASEVPLDVVVKDKKGRAIKNLSPADFEVYEDGVRQDVKSFRFVTRGEAGGSSAGANETTETRPNVPPRPAVRPLSSVNTIALVFDRLSPDARRRATTAALAYVAENMRGDDFAGVFTTGLSLGVVQQYTNDAPLVRAAVERVGSQDQPREAPTREQTRALSEQLAKVLQRPPREQDPDKTMLRMAIGSLDDFQNLERSQQGLATTNGLLAVVNSLRDAPGRKALIFFSEGVAIPPAVQTSFRSVVATANRSGVAIYTVDAAGLRAESAVAETRKEIETRSAVRMGLLGTADEELGGPMTKSLERNEDILRLNPESGLGQLADGTGGFFIRDTNDLRGRLGQIDQDLRAYYLLSYAPQNQNYDGRFRAVEVKVKRSGLTVQSRKGYFAVNAAYASPVLAHEAPALAALERDSPPHDFAVRAAVMSFPETARPGLVPVVVEVPSGAMTFAADEAKKRYATDFSVVVVVKDEGGQVVRKISNQYRLNGALADLAAARRGEVLFYRELDLDPGEYTVHAVVRDGLANKTSVETNRLTVPEAGEAKLRLSSVVIVKRAEPLNVADRQESNPFHVGASVLYPDADALPRTKEDGDRANRKLPFFFTAYPAKGGAPAAAQLTVTLTPEGGLPIGRTSGALPAPDARGRIQYAGALPLGNVAEGTYELKITVADEHESVSRSARFVLGRPSSPEAIQAAVKQREAAEKAAAEQVIAASAKSALLIGIEEPPPPTSAAAAVPPADASPSPLVAVAASSVGDRPEVFNRTSAGGAEEVDEDDVVRVNTTFVSVPVQVRDGKGRYIPDLRQQDFNLFEDEAVQRIAYFAGVDEPFTVALLLDTSASARSELGRIQRAAMAFVDQLRANDRVLVVAFDDQIRAMAEPTADREVLHRAILSTRTGDGTILYDAVNFVIKQRLRRLAGRKAVVLFTDGEDGASRHATYAANVRDAEQSGLLCYTIMYTNFPPRLDWMRPVPPAYLRDLARHTGGRYYRLTPKDTLAGTFALIAEELRRQYSLGYYPQTPAPESKANRKIKVKVSKSDAVVRSRESYLEKEGESPAGQR